MERDFTVFPKDENGETLWFACQRGLEIGVEHRVRFALIFPEGDSALKFGVFLLRHGYWVQVNELDDKPGYLGEVLVDMGLDVTHEKITGAESWLSEQSHSIGGKADGWEIKEKIPSLVSSEFHEFADS